MIEAVARPLSQRESDALDVLLSCDFIGVEGLRRQADSVTVGDEGLIVDLIVDSSSPPVAVSSGVPVYAPVTDPDGNSGGLLAHPRRGCSSGAAIPG